MLEERCRKMVQLIREKKKEKQRLKQETDDIEQDKSKYTMEELEKIQNQIKEAEQEKVVEERKLRSQITQQEQNIKQL
jgi:hypothetical protein